MNFEELLIEYAKKVGEYVRGECDRMAQREARAAVLAEYERLRQENAKLKERVEELEFSLENLGY